MTLEKKGISYPSETEGNSIGNILIEAFYLSYLSIFIFGYILPTAFFLCHTSLDIR